MRKLPLSQFKYFEGWSPMVDKIKFPNAESKAKINNTKKREIFCDYKVGKNFKNKRFKYKLFVKIVTLVI